MKEEELGKEGEHQAMVILKKMGFKLQSPDWLASKDGKVICIEVKKKSRRFSPPPFEGHGLDIRQVYLRTKLLKETGIRTYIMIFEDWSNKVFGNYLDILENGEKADAPFGKIRIYPIKNFIELLKP